MKCSIISNFCFFLLICSNSSGWSFPRNSFRIRFGSVQQITFCYKFLIHPLEKLTFQSLCQASVRHNNLLFLSVPRGQKGVPWIPLSRRWKPLSEDEVNMPHRRYVQDSQTLIFTQHCLQKNILFTSNKILLLSWFQVATKTLRRLWHKPWFLQGMENTDCGVGAKWYGTEGYLPNVSAQERRNKCKDLYSILWQRQHMAEEFHGTEGILIFLQLKLGVVGAGWAQSTGNAGW